MRLALDAAAAAHVSDRIDAFVRGDEPLTGLDLYYELERATPLREFHTMLRLGPQNRTRSGLQQSYGDHNRLLLLGLDRLTAGDVEWYRSRLETPGGVPDDRLAACVSAAAALAIDRRALVALWLAAALHDCGMLGGSPANVDVEDGVALAADLLDALCPPELRELAEFGIRNHDFIKDVFTGEVAPAFIADQIGRLDASQRATASCALGMIQVAGAASLGEGRLSPFRISICELCFRGDALSERSPITRLGRLLGTDQETTDATGLDTAEQAASSVGGAAREQLFALLDRTSIFGWHKWVRAQGARSPEALASTLAGLATTWHGARADHIVLSPGWQPSEQPAAPDVRALGSGATVLVVDAPGAMVLSS